MDCGGGPFCRLRTCLFLPLCQHEGKMRQGHQHHRQGGKAEKIHIPAVVQIQDGQTLHGRTGEEHKVGAVGEQCAVDLNPKPFFSHMSLLHDALKSSAWLSINSLTKGVPYHTTVSKKF